MVCNALVLVLSEPVDSETRDVLFGPSFGHQICSDDASELEAVSGASAYDNDPVVARVEIDDEVFVGRIGVDASRPRGWFGSETRKDPSNELADRSLVSFRNVPVNPIRAQRFPAVVPATLTP